MAAQATAADFRRLGVISGPPVAPDSLPGFADDDLTQAWTAFRRSCATLATNTPPPPPGAEAGAAMQGIAESACALDAPDTAAIRAFLTEHFDAWRVDPGEGRTRGFLTGYYEPVVDGAWTPDASHTSPLLALPDDLVALRPGDDRHGLPEAVTAARRRPDGAYEPYPTRKEIETRAGDTALLYVRDPVEAFMIQVQGSATIRIGDELVPVSFAGRNGRPFTAIGRVLAERGEMTPAEITLARLKQWVRDHGQAPGEAGRDLLWRNESFIFFAIDRDEARKVGPIGAAGLPLQPLRSLAVDHRIWPYGLLFWIDARFPWRGPAPEPFRRLMVAQDTGSAIIGPARADLYVGAGDDAGAIAGGIRDAADMYVLVPRTTP